MSEHGNEHLGLVKAGEFLDKLSEYPLMKKDFAPRS